MKKLEKCPWCKKFYTSDVVCIKCKRKGVMGYDRFAERLAEKKNSS